MLSLGSWASGAKALELRAWKCLRGPGFYRAGNSQRDSFVPGNIQYWGWDGSVGANGKRLTVETNAFAHSYSHSTETQDQQLLNSKPDRVLGVEANMEQYYIVVL